MAGAAALAYFQALLWFPFPLPWLRTPLLLIELGLFPGSVVLAERGTSELVLVAASLVVLLASYALALSGVSRSRRGAGTWERCREDLAVASAGQPTAKPFPSPMQAQEWLEARRLRWGFVAVTLLCLLFALQMMGMTQYIFHTIRGLTPEDLEKDLPHLREALTLWGREWLVISQLTVFGLLISAAIGGSSLGRLTTRAESPVVSAFLATRPMRTADLIKAKLLICARGTIILWAILFLTGLLWAACMGWLGEMADRLVARTGSLPGAVLALVVGVVLLPVLSWLWLISGMGMKVLRWPILEMVPAFFTLGLLMIVGLLNAGKFERWLPVLGWIVSGILVAKVVAVCWVVSRVRRERIVGLATLAWALVGWGLLAAVMVGVAIGWLSAGPLLSAFVLLLLPLARPLAAPLGLARHRTQ
jgi:hypothetical protein